MELGAIAETTVEMWVLIQAKLVARSQDKIDPAIKATILREAMSLYMTNIINEAKHGSTPKADKHKDNEHCQKCGRKFTEREMGFLEGTTDMERICYHCSKGLN